MTNFNKKYNITEGEIKDIELVDGKYKLTSIYESGGVYIESDVVYVDI
jgi:hypothetical protein